MCHVSPTAQILGLLVTLIGGSFVVWHILCFDRGRCLIFSRRNMFRWGESFATDVFMGTRIKGLTGGMYSRVGDALVGTVIRESGSTLSPTRRLTRACSF